MTRRRSTARGQALVEFALVIPIFLLLLFGLIDGGRYVYMNNVLSQAAREAARVGAAEASWIGKTTAFDPGCVATPAAITAANPGAHVCPATATGATNSLQADITAAANRMTSPFGDVQHVYFSCQPIAAVPPANWATSVPTDCVAANRTNAKNALWVKVEMTYQPITPVLGQIFKDTNSGSATMVLN